MPSFAVVEGALARPLALEGHLAVVGLERVGHGGRAGRSRRALVGEAAEVGAPAPAERVLAVALRSVLLPRLHVLGRRARVREGHAAELADARPVARVHPAVRRDDPGVLARAGERDRLLDRLLAHVVGVDDHPLVHHPALDVLARARSARACCSAAQADRSATSRWRQPERAERAGDGRVGRARRRRSGCRAAGRRTSRALQNEPALSLLAPLMSAPIGPQSKRTPASGLSNLFSSRLDRTPRS